MVVVLAVVGRVVVVVESDDGSSELQAPSASTSATVTPTLSPLPATRRSYP